MRRLTASALIATIALMGCYSWQEYEGPLESLRGDTLSVARIQFANGYQHEFRDVTVGIDSLFATHPSSENRFVQVPRDTVVSIEMRHFSPGLTAVAVLVASAAAGLFYAMTRYFHAHTFQ